MIDTDTDGGTGIGLVAMIEVVALMIGDIVQCYSETQYLDPRTVQRGMLLRKGCPKSLYQPGSSGPCCSVRKTGSISLPICCVIYIVRMSGAASQQALVDHWWKPT